MNSMRIGAGLVMLVLLAACGSNKEEQEAAQAAAQAARLAAIKKAQQAKRAEDPLAGLAKVIALSRGNLPVDLRFELTTAPQPNVAAQLRLALLAKEDLEAVLVALTPVNDLTLEGEQRPRFGPTKTGELRDVTISVRAPAAGIYLTHVDVTVTRPGGDTTYEFVLPVGVPVAAEKTATK